MTIFAKTPVFRFSFDKKYEEYIQFKTLLINELSGIDTQGKIVFDDNTHSVQIYYYPRIFQALLSDEFIQKQIWNKIDDDTYAALCEEYSVDRILNPIIYLQCFLDKEYKNNHDKNFYKLVSKFDRITPLNHISSFSLKAPSDNKDAFCNVVKNVFINNLGIGTYDHSHLNPGRFVLDNLKTLHDNNFKIIFLEGIPQEAQELIDSYLLSDNDALPEELRRIFDFNDTDKLKSKILISAKRMGLRVVGLDSQATYKIVCDYNDKKSVNARIKAFNYHAFKIIDRESRQHKNAKFVFICGSDHLLLSTDDKIPGLARFFDCTALIIGDLNHDHSKEEYFIIPSHICDTFKKLLTYKINTWPSPNVGVPLFCDFLMETRYDSELAIDKCMVPASVESNSKQSELIQFFAKNESKETMKSSENVNPLICSDDLAHNQTP